MNNGRDKLPWGEEIWARIDKAVHDECQRTQIARKFIPLYGPVSPGELTVPKEEISFLPGINSLGIDEAATNRIIELLVEFTLTPQQVEREEELMTAACLATRAANLLSQAEDLVIFQGDSVIDSKTSTMLSGKVRAKNQPFGKGLVNVVYEDKKPEQFVKVPPESASAPKRYGEATFAAVSKAYSNLQSGTNLEQAHYGPYALVLHFEPFADTHAPLKTTLIMPADRIKPLVPAGFYGTGTLPSNGDPVKANRKTAGVLVSIGGDTMDLVVSVDATTAFLQEDTDGRFRFRVYERLALRIKDKTSIVRLDFE